MSCIDTTGIVRHAGNSNQIFSELHRVFLNKEWYLLDKVVFVIEIGGTFTVEVHLISDYFEKGVNQGWTYNKKIKKTCNDLYIVFAWPAKSCSQISSKINTLLSWKISLRWNIVVQRVEELKACRVRHDWMSFDQMYTISRFTLKENNNNSNYNKTVVTTTLIFKLSKINFAMSLLLSPKAEWNGL